MQTAFEDSRSYSEDEGVILKRKIHLFCTEHGSGVLGDGRYNARNPLLSCHLTYMDMACRPRGQTLNIPVEVSHYILVMISISSVLLCLIEMIIMTTAQETAEGQVQDWTPQLCSNCCSGEQ